MNNFSADYYFEDEAGALEQQDIKKEEEIADYICEYFNGRKNAMNVISPIKIIKIVNTGEDIDESYEFSIVLDITTIKPRELVRNFNTQWFVKRLKSNLETDFDANFTVKTYADSIEDDAGFVIGTVMIRAN